MRLSHACAFVCSVGVFWTAEAFAPSKTAGSFRLSTDLGLLSKIKQKLGKNTKRGRGDGYGKRLAGDRCKT